MKPHGQGCFEYHSLAFSADQRPGIVLAQEGWHEGILGIAASRIARRYQRPAVLLAINGTEFRRQMTGDILLGFRILEKLCLLLRDRVQAMLGAMDNL